ncbi:ethanolamine utilization protein EutJ [Bradyrhizobium jicamae]|uniref:Ethanolamine utilization protein EutJ n=1 Tax=Bradyrhizobium jicamae TaxID=280332 RepID=A0ABS5FXL3_9BRAD|nr:ethanolamine utilization protein EutJ [Bradyrhizobium jicamae]MBR0801574.1 ethanolamine utilization protein EutJ [Bradyrhizobium jicamae]MBR0939256.1 ethanolamine utilization protein EutJ [Bradyrhizobium jicamae]
MLARVKSNVSSVNLETVAFLEAAAATFRAPTSNAPVFFGVDLGTATIVLTAVDEEGSPVYWDSLPCQAVRDGVVVNFGDAVTAVKQLKTVATTALRTEISAAATAFPPGVPEAEARACRYVLENAGITCRHLVDEVSAAQALLRLDNGAIVDVGGGSTGVGIVENGTIVALDDEPGGGHHLDLILAGALRIPIEDAEERKRLGKEDYSHILRPGVERIASSILRQIRDRTVQSIHLVGGAVRVPHAATIVSHFCGIETWAYPHSELVTPFGIAKS